MAHKKMYAIAPMRYGTRMLKAGEAVTMSAPQALLHHAMGHVTSKRPDRPKPAEPPAPVAKPAQPEPVVAERPIHIEPEPIHTEPVDDLSELRAAYQAKFDKRPFHGWDADELRQRIAAA